MEVVVGLHNIRSRHRGCVLTVGSFDGVHRGHQKLLSQLVQKSRDLATPSMLLTFEPTPREFFRGDAVPARLTRFREKITLLERTELDRVLCLPFNERTARTSADWVVDELLANRLGVRHLVVGDDFRFGHGARGDFQMLEEAGGRHGFGVERMQTLMLEGERVSSTRVRKALADGDFALAEALLGHPYFMMGRVVYGRQLGRQLGVPTANIRLQRYRTPLQGVFAVTVDGLDRTHQGIANVGVRPTVEGKEPLLEVHLFDFADDVYGRLLTVEFKRKIRDERAFDGLDALKAQIDRDIVETREFFANA
ncbi:MAG: bifunctional riboflavin kinase/FAD synthetase [Pseudomonadales bacterium]